MPLTKRTQVRTPRKHKSSPKIKCKSLTKKCELSIKKSLAKKASYPPKEAQITGKENANEAIHIKNNQVIDQQTAM